MNISKEPLSETSAKIVVKLDEADYKDKVNAELKRIGQTHVIPGFRKGHISIEQLRRRFGREVKSDIMISLRKRASMLSAILLLSMLLKSTLLTKTIRLSTR